MPTRRNFVKLSSLALAGTILPITGCPGTNLVIGALRVAGAVASSAAGILRTIAPNLANVLSTVSADLTKVADLYKQYESAAGDKPTKFQLIQATLSTITTNLSDILSAIHVFNPALMTIIRTAIAIVNSAISLIISHLPQPHKTAAQAQRLALPPLPVIDGAKSAGDLKKAWNETVRGSYPSAVVQ